MKIKLRTSMAGQFFDHQYGAVIDVDPAEAKRLIDRDLADHYVEKKIDVPAEREKVIERAVAAPPPERAISVAPAKARFQQHRGDHR